jgi:hypothetical protein
VATLGERIIEVLRVNPTGLDDDQLAEKLGVVRQAVNQACRRLATAERLMRGVGPDGKIINRLVHHRRRRLGPSPRRPGNY